MLRYAAKLLCVTLSLPIAFAMKSHEPAQEGAFGAPRIAKYYGGAKAAVSLQFDDSMISQLENAVPLLNRRGLRATFFINPARPQHQGHLREWEVDVPKAGHELANHTLSHTGARNAEEADAEIGACSAVLRKIYGEKPRIMVFGQPGGVPWDVTPEQLAPIFQKYRLVPAVGRTFFDEKETDPVSIAQKTLDQGGWVQLGMHGTGGEWLSTSVPAITRLFDFLAERRPEVWTAPTVEVYKYTRERDAAHPLRLTAVSARGFTVSVECDSAKLETFGRPLVELYDQPLTVEVPVPDSWRSVTVRGARGRLAAKTVRVAGETLARFDVLPNAGPVRVAKD
jgi:hypothetical protein